MQVPLERCIGNRRLSLVVERGLAVEVEEGEGVEEVEPGEEEGVELEDEVFTQEPSSKPPLLLSAFLPKNLILKQL